MISALKIGMIIMVSSMIWMSVVFLDAQRTTDNIILETNHSSETELEFAGQGIGYYKIYFPQYFGKGVFVQILDDKNNVIAEKKIETKMSINYFDYTTGKYTAKITNLSEGKASLEIEFGGTNSEELVYPGVPLIIGTAILLVALYNKMRNYRMAQPDENIS